MEGARARKVETPGVAVLIGLAVLGSFVGRELPSEPPKPTPPERLTGCGPRRLWQCRARSPGVLVTRDRGRAGHPTVERHPPAQTGSTDRTISGRRPSVVIRRGWAKARRRMAVWRPLRGSGRAQARYWTGPDRVRPLPAHCLGWVVGTPQTIRVQRASASGGTAILPPIWFDSEMWVAAGP